MKNKWLFYLQLSLGFFCLKKNKSYGQINSIQTLHTMSVKSLLVEDCNPYVPQLSIEKMQNASKSVVKKYNEYPYYYLLHYDFYSTIMANFAHNPIDPGTDHSNIYFYYNLSFNNRLQLNKIRINTYFFNEFGKRFYFDSLSVIGADQYYFKNTFSKALIKDKLSLSTFLNIKSQFWRHYDYEEDSVGNEQKQLYSAYFTPGYILFSLGLTYNFWEGSSLSIGLASGKITKLKNHEVWEHKTSDALFGVPKGKRTDIIYGISFQANILPKKIGKHFYWVNNSSFYIPNKYITALKYYTLDFTNALHYLFLKYLRISWETQIEYDLNMQEKPEIINRISFGFYLSNLVEH